MQRLSTIFLQVALVLIGVGALAVMIRFPLTEGRAVHLDLFSIYADPFLVYGYLSSIAFFVVLYQAFKLFGYVRQDTAFSPSSLKALRTITYCALILSVSIVMAALYIMIFHAGDDDPAGFIAVSMVTTFSSLAVAAAANVGERMVQRAIEMKSRSA